MEQQQSSPSCANFNVVVIFVVVVIIPDETKERETSYIGWYWILRSNNLQTCQFRRIFCYKIITPRGTSSIILIVEKIVPVIIININKLS